MQPTSIISEAAIQRRTEWIKKLRGFSDNFGIASQRIEDELRAERADSGVASILDHLRLCGDMPESFGHDSTEEKLYSKYIDSLISEAFRAMDLRSLVLQERADAADVEAFSESYSFVADAKSFRLSRSAKNQKDFKVQAMDGWKRGKPYAMVVCPIHQLPANSSQIYQQASARNVCIFTYSHLSVMVAFGIAEGTARAQRLLLSVFESVPALNPTKQSIAYWQAVNSTMLGFSKLIPNLWQTEKQASIEALRITKEEALSYLASEREKIIRMDRDEAVRELLRASKIDGKISVIQAISTSRIMEVAE